MNIFKRIIFFFRPDPFPGDVWGSLSSPDMILVVDVKHGLVSYQEIKSVRRDELVVSSYCLCAEMHDFKQQFPRRYMDLEELPVSIDLSDIIHERPARRR